MFGEMQSPKGGMEKMFKVSFPILIFESGQSKGRGWGAATASISDLSIGEISETRKQLKKA